MEGQTAMYSMSEFSSEDPSFYFKDDAFLTMESISGSWSLDNALNSFESFSSAKYPETSSASVQESVDSSTSSTPDVPQNNFSGDVHVPTITIKQEPNVMSINYDNKSIQFNTKPLSDFTSSFRLPASVKNEEDEPVSAMIEDQIKKHTVIKGQNRMLDVSILLGFSQRKAAKILNIPNSTFSKRWRQATNNRKWPYRLVAKLDRTIQTLIQNIPHSHCEKAQEMKDSLTKLINLREEECKAVFVPL